MPAASFYFIGSRLWELATGVLFFLATCQGKAGEALGISLYSGFVGGLFGLAVLVLLAQPLSSVALAFTPTSYFALGVLGLSIIGSVSGNSLVKGLIAALFGLIISSIGTDPVTGVSRFTFGSPELLSGIPPILVMVGLFAVGELLAHSGEPGWQKASSAEGPPPYSA